MIGPIRSWFGLDCVTAAGRALFPRVGLRQLLLIAGVLLAGLGASGESTPASGRTVWNFNPDWRFIRADVPGAEKPEFDARGWQTVSCPHTWNDTDTFDDFARGGHTGETNLWTGAAWYRKQFVLPAGASGKKVFIEFEGVRQIAEVYLNGQLLGRDVTGFIPFGFDLTPHVRFGATNILAVRADNRFDEQYAGDQPWNHPNWHPPHGGIYRNVRLHLTDPLHVTLPLYAHLQTEGIYAWVDTLTPERAELGVTAELQNSQAVEADCSVRFELVDRAGQVVAHSVEPAKLAPNEKRKVAARLAVSQPQFWQPSYPYVYQVRVSVSRDGVTRDVAETPFGIRSFRFDVATGFWINGSPLKLHGWGQKPTQEWPGLGAALPDWLRDHTLQLMREAGGNFLRWGHCAGSATETHFGDKYGFVTIMPGVDGERDCQGKAWATRAAAFRDLIVYFRNHPSICIWEGGNYNVSPAHAAELRRVVETWDPHGKRYFGFRMSAPGMLPSLDLELGTIGRQRALPMLPVVETEYDRTETPRRLWDRFSPPDFGRMGANEELNTYRFDSEMFATNAVVEWWSKFGSDPSHSGGANWIFSDGPHGSRQVTDVARASGEVDGVRLPKEAYWALQTIWRDEPRVHLIGHWNYPAGTVKTVFAVAQADTCELFVNGRSFGPGERTQNYLFAWPDVKFAPGEIRVEARTGGAVVAKQTKVTAGPPAALRLTPITAPGGWRADGSDVALVDVEVVDAQGHRCPTDQARVDFEAVGPAIWRGGYNSGKEHSVNNLWLDTECGIARVSLRATTTPGVVTLTARRAGLPPARIELRSGEFSAPGGLAAQAPDNLPVKLGEPPAIRADALAQQVALAAAHCPGGQMAVNDRMFSTFAYTGNGAGGGEVPAIQGALAYSDDAVLTLRTLPSVLAGARLIRTASRDNSYWAADYIVASAARDLTLYVAHDARVPLPQWLRAFEATAEVVEVNGQRLKLFSRQLKKDDELRISGNGDQGQMRAGTLNFILFACLVDTTAAVSR